VEALLSEDCERARSRASLALDCELSQLERAHLRAHLDDCASCAVFVAGLREVTHELRAAPLPAPSRPLLPRRRRGRGPAAIALLLVVAAAGAGGLAGSLTTEQAPVHAITTQSGLPGARLVLRAAI
jgi:anti-sigma factor RsiW